ncbi:hypothetical protein Bbelb_035330 [Branchiostoma belcheri]|nr:hypothetical protein Bbelb_035330 [Branchiostoma belcheri]
MRTEKGSNEKRRERGEAKMNAQADEHKMLLKEKLEQQGTPKKRLEEFGYRGLCLDEFDIVDQGTVERILWDFKLTPSQTDSLKMDFNDADEGYESGDEVYMFVQEECTRERNKEHQLTPVDNTRSCDEAADFLQLCHPRPKISGLREAHLATNQESCSPAPFTDYQVTMFTFSDNMEEALSEVSALMEDATVASLVAEDKVAANKKQRSASGTDRRQVQVKVLETQHSLEVVNDNGVVLRRRYHISQFIFNSTRISQKSKQSTQWDKVVWDDWARAQNSLRTVGDVEPGDNYFIIPVDLSETS